MVAASTLQGNGRSPRQEYNGSNERRRMLEFISECRGDNTNCHLKMESVSGSFLKLQNLHLAWELSESDVVLLTEALKVNSTLTGLYLSPKMALVIKVLLVLLKNFNSDSVRSM